jgi:hypothetical protein
VLVVGGPIGLIFYLCGRGVWYSVFGWQIITYGVFALAGPYLTSGVLRDDFS